MLLHRCLDHFGISPEGLRGMLEGEPVLPYCHEDYFAIRPAGLRGMLEGMPIPPHRCKHDLA
eukprot:5026020-Amphidinium_carterae.1